MLLLDPVWLRSFSLSLAFCIGLWSVIFIGQMPKQNTGSSQPAPTFQGTGSAADAGPRLDIKPGDLADVSRERGTRSLKIIRKPKPNYTVEARANQVQGTVILRVTFTANGAIGRVSVVKGLSDGLNEQAIAAAHQIEFEPARTDGKPTAVTKQVEYTFSIY